MLLLIPIAGLILGQLNTGVHLRYDFFCGVGMGDNRIRQKDLLWFDKGEKCKGIR